MLIPKRVKYQKQMRGRMKGIAGRGNKVSFGEYGLKATTRGRITARQIEAARRTITRKIKRGGKLWIIRVESRQGREVSGVSLQGRTGREDRHRWSPAR